MKQLDLRAIGLDELHPDEMRNVEGGFWFIVVAILFFAIPAAAVSGAQAYYGYDDLFWW